MAQLSNWLKQSKTTEIAVAGPACYAAPIFGVPKKNPGEVRWVIDLKERNRITIKDYTPIPNQGYNRDDVARHPYRSKIDMSNAYYQIRIEPKDEHKNAITAGQFGAWQIKVMLQGDCNAPATMMRIMNTILSPYLGKLVWVYLDDILIFSNTKKEHIDHLRKIFGKLKEHRFYLRIDKCNLMMDEIEVLGHTIRGNKIMPSAEKITHIADFPTPKNKKQLQQFLGSVNYVGGHLPHIASVQAPLTELTGTSAWEWNDLQDTAFAKTKEACRQNLPLSPINYDQITNTDTPDKLFLVTDASKVGVGSFICHGESFEKAKQNIAAIHSRKFLPAQFNYTTTDQEMLAIVDALKTFEHKLLGVKFTIATDHMALKTLMSRTVKNQRQIRWLERITMFDFEIIHIDGRENMLADALSRIFEGVEERELTENDYLQEDEDMINTDGFLPEEEGPEDDNPSASPMSILPQPHSHPVVIPTLHRENATLQENPTSMEIDELINHDEPQELGPSPPVVRIDYDGYTGLLYGDGCDAPSMFWEDCRATNRCEAHLAHCVDAFSYRMDGIPRRTISANTCYPSSTPSSGSTAADATVPAADEPGATTVYSRRHHPESPPANPLNEQPQRGTDGEVRRLLWDYIRATDQGEQEVRESINEAQWAAAREAREAGGSPPSIDPALLRVHHPEEEPPARTPTPEGWKERSVPTPASVFAFANLRPTETSPPPPQVGSHAVTRNRTRQAGEGSVGEGDGKKNKTQKHHESDADGEMSDKEEEDSDGLSDDAGKDGMEDMREWGQGLEREEKEEDVVMDDWVREDVGCEQNFIWNEGQHIHWGRCYFEALTQDPTFGGESELRQPFYRNGEGFILKAHPSEGGNRVYIPEGNVQIGGESYGMRELLIQAAHHRLAHYGVSKTFRDLARDTYWPGQWDQTVKFIQRCDVCQRNKQPTQRPPGTAQMVQIPERPWQSICMDTFGPLPTSSGFKHALVVVDRFSSSVRIVPLKDKFTAREICDALLSKIYCYYGTPQEIITDRGPQFVSQFYT